jgi:hypothetical protein
MVLGAPARSGNVTVLAEVDENFVASNFDRIAVDAHAAVRNDLASGDVILPSMPRAGHDLSFELAFTERAGLVQAYAIDSVKLT